MLDWWLRLDDPGLRWLLSLTVGGAFAAVVWRTLVKPLREELSDVVLARQLDRRYPGLAHRLSVAAEFQTGRFDPARGSTELQALVVRQAAADLRQVAPDEVLDPRRLTPWLGGALAGCLVTGLILWAYPLEGSTAIQRLSRPWSATPWPRRTQLELTYADGRPLAWDPRTPLRVVRGGTLDLAVRNQRGALPVDLTLETRVPGESWSESSLVATRLSSTTPGDEPAAVTLTALADHLEFRVKGGDDVAQPWHGLEAIDPPQATRIDITLTPPRYTGLPLESLPPGTTQVRGWLGSTVKLDVAADRPVARVERRVGDQTSDDVVRAADGRTWSTTLRIDQPGTTNVAFVQRDALGFAAPAPLTLELRGEVDALPQVVLQQPAADLWVTPDAVVAIAAEASDDLGLTSLQRAWQRDGQPLEVTPLESWSTRPTQASHAGPWELAPLGLQPGERIVFRLEALDACDLGEPHVGRSAPRSLLVVTATEKQRELTERMAEIVGDLHEAIRQQRGLRQQTQALNTQLDTQPEDGRVPRDQLQRLQADQRRLAEQSGAAARGLAERAAQLRDEFPANRLSDPEAEPQLDRLTQELAELTSDVFPPIDRALTRATKELESAPESAERSETDARAAAQAALTTAEALQQTTLEALEARAAELARWQGERQAGGQLEAARDEQRQLREAAAELGAQTLSRALPELTPQERTDLNRLADRQRALANRTNDLARNFRELAERLEADDLGRAAQAADLAEQLDEAQLAARQRQAGDDLAANRWGAAGPLQQEVEATLDRLTKEWSECRPDDLEQMIKQTDEARQATAALADDVDELRKEADPQGAAAGNGEPDAAKQGRERAEQLRKWAQRLERELQRLRLDRESTQARRAADLLKAAEAALAQGDDTAAAKKLAEAAEQLEELETELQASREQLQERLAQEELARIADKLRAIATRQQGALVELERLAAEQESKGRLTRGQLRSLQDLAATEQELARLTTEAAEPLTAAVVARAALDSVARSLKQAATRLDARTTDDITQQFMQDAAKRLERIIAAWEAQAPNAPTDELENDPPETPDGDDKGAQTGPPGESIALRQQLQLLRELQADCLERTAALETRRQPDGGFPEAWLPLIDDLAAEQGALITLLEELAQEITDSQSIVEQPEQP
jgi:hypothetical protein